MRHAFKTLRATSSFEALCIALYTQLERIKRLCEYKLSKAGSEVKWNEIKLTKNCVITNGIKFSSKQSLKSQKENKKMGRKNTCYYVIQFNAI